MHMQRMFRDSGIKQFNALADVMVILRFMCWYISDLVRFFIGLLDNFVGE